MTDKATPRTDELCLRFVPGYGLIAAKFDLIGFARKLERELGEAKQELEGYAAGAKLVMTAQNEERKQAEQRLANEVTALNATITRINQLKRRLEEQRKIAFEAAQCEWICDSCEGGDCQVAVRVRAALVDAAIEQSPAQEKKHD